MYINNELQQVYPSTWVWNGVQYPQAIFVLWSNEELASVGVYRTIIDDVPTPTGKHITGYVFRIEGDTGYANPVFEDVPVTTPYQVSKGQGKAALLFLGLYDDALSYIASLEGTEKTLAEIAFNDTLVWERDSQFLTQFATHLGLSDEALDSLFSAAADIKL